MGKRKVARERPALAAALARVVVVVLALAVRTAVVVVAGGPMEGGVVVDTGLSYSRHRRGRCGGGIPQLLSGSVVVGSSGAGLLSSGKVQPSLVSTMAVVDMLLNFGGRFLRIFLVELLDKVG